jgi:NADH-quinone oxidoreductase subunit J
MTPQLLAFWIVAALSVVTALGVVLHRNPVRSALLLIVNFFCLAVLYLMQNAQVLAMLQILVYAGAIMVLFLFVIMLLNLGGEATHADPLVGQRFVGLVLGLFLLGGLIYAINSAGLSSTHSLALTAGGQRAVAAEGQGISQIQVIGWDLFTRYVYPFELTSILLLVGAVGVMILTKRRPNTVSRDARP